MFMLLFKEHALLNFCPSDYVTWEDLLKNNRGINASEYNKFRLKKYNDIWVRARAKRFSKEKLERLEKTLSKLDKMELEVKHWDLEEQNEYNELKPKVQEYLNEVLEEYGLLQNDMVDHEHSLRG